MPNKTAERNIRNFSLHKLFFISLIVIYALIIVAGAELGPADEFAFLSTLQSGMPFPYYDRDFPYFDTYAMGRFIPLGGQEYNLVGLISNDPFWYFAVNAFEFVLFAILLLKILQQFSDNKLLIYSSVLLVFFVPGFTINFFKLLNVEKNVIFYLAIFLASYLSFIKEQRILTFIFALVSANIAIYYKETVFVAITAFAVSHLLFSWRKINVAGKILDSLLILSSFVYVIIYLLIVFPHRGEIIYNQSIYDPLLVLTKNLLNYSFFSDPIPILLIPLALVRLYQILLRRRDPVPFLDSMIIAGVTYVAAYLVLNIYSPYYLLPVYVFALPSLVYFYERGELKGTFWKASSIIVGIVLLTNTLPSGIYYLTYHKYISKNFNNVINYLAADINNKYNGQRINIFIDGVDRGTGQGVYIIFGEYLKYKGLSIRKFDLKTDMEAMDKRPFAIRPSPFDKESDLDAIGVPSEYPRLPFTVFQKGKLQKINSGDYLVVSPHSTKNVNQEYLASLKKDYQLLYRTESPLAFPNINLKTGIKYLMSKKLTAKQKSGGVIVNENLMNWPDYYVFVRK